MNYDVIAPYYDLIHADLTEDVDFVLALAGAQAGPVVELGCGTGRLLLPLARAGHRVIGIDNSRAMLLRAEAELAKENAAVRERVTLHEKGIEDLRLVEPAGLILAAYNTWLHVAHDQMGLLLRRLRSNLRADGRLFLDLPNPFAISTLPNDHLLTLERAFQDPDSGDLVQQLASSHVDDTRQVLRISWLFDRIAENGGPLHRTVVTAEYHYLYPHEVTLLLEGAELRTEALFGYYDRSPFDEAGERLLVIAAPA